MNKYAIPVGIILGAFSWGVVTLVSDVYEPFDNPKGFYIGQVVLSFTAGYFGYIGGFKTVIIYLMCAYIGMNSYAYIFGSDEDRAWFGLGLITTLVLFIYPLLSGLFGKLVMYTKTSLSIKFGKPSS